MRKSFAVGFAKCVPVASALLSNIEPETTSRPTAASAESVRSGSNAYAHTDAFTGDRDRRRKRKEIVRVNDPDRHRKARATAAEGTATTGRRGDGYPMADPRASREVVCGPDVFGV